MVPPVPLGYVLAPCRREHRGGTAVGEAGDGLGPTLDLPVQALDSVVGADSPPVLGREARVGERLHVPLLDDPSGVGEPRGPQRPGHLLRLTGGRLQRLLGVYRLELAVFSQA